MTEVNEFTALRDDLTKRVLKLWCIDADENKSLCEKMHEAIQSARSMKLLRIYDEHLLEQKNLYLVHTLVESAGYVLSLHEGNGTPAFTLEHQSRLSSFDFELSKAGNSVFASAKTYRDYAPYMEAMRCAAVISDASTFAYLKENLVSLSKITMERKITDAGRLAEMIKVMADGSNVLIDGAL